MTVNLPDLQILFLKVKKPLLYITVYAGACMYVCSVRREYWWDAEETCPPQSVNEMQIKNQYLLNWLESLNSAQIS